MLQRKETLLVEYKQLRKANAFVDRRFGESDDSLTAEEKAIARFQKQRMKEFAGGILQLFAVQARLSAHTACMQTLLVALPTAEDAPA